MKKLMDWLSESFAPNANKLFSKPWIAAISSAMQKVVPFILTGSLIYFYNVIKSFVPILPDLSPIANYSFGLIVTVQPFGFPVTESAHSKSPSARVRFFLGQIDVIVRTLQQVQSPGLNCYDLFLL